MLQQQFPGASAARLPSGAYLVTVPDFPVCAGWTLSRTTVWFIVPVGYPYANPDCFWVDKGLQLATGAMPQNSNITVVPETNITGIWFSWHLAHPWNPNTDTLLTWTAVISNRLRAAR